MKLRTGVIFGLVVLAALFCISEAPAVQTDNHVLHAVPRPGAVAIDGKLGDWDLSGQIECFPSFRMRDVYSAKAAAMYDKDFLYVTVTWRDPTPMHNMVDPDTDGNGWKSDCLQLRVITDVTLHVDCWYAASTGRPVVKILYGTLNPGEQNVSKFAPFTKPNAIDEGAREAFALGEDGQSYTQEVALPWKLITGQNAIVKETGKPYAAPMSYQAGDTFNLGLDFGWGGTDGRTAVRLRHPDLIKQGAVTRGANLFWADDACWGTVKLEPNGRLNLPRPDWQAMADLVRQKTGGPITLEYTMPFDGFATLVIEDEQGIRVRNLVGMAPRGKGEREDYWDLKGEDGKPVSPGKYRWHGLFRKGIDPAYEFTFGTPNPRGAQDATADPDDKTRVFAGGCEFKLDYKTGQAAVVAGGLGDVSGQLMKFQGREYFMSKTGRLSLRKGNASKPVAHMAWFMWKDGPAFMEEYPFLARGQMWDSPPAGPDGKALPSGPIVIPTPARPGSRGIPDAHGEMFSTSFLWMDLNDDGRPQAERENNSYLPKTWTDPGGGGKSQENEILAGSRYATSENWRYPLGVPHPLGGYWLDEGFNLYSCGVEAGYHQHARGVRTGMMGPVVVKIPLKGWTPGGAPVWDVKNQQLLIGLFDARLAGPGQGKAFEVHLPNGQTLFSRGQCNWFPGECLYLPAEGKVVVGPPITGIRDDGTILWTYRDDWPGPLRAYWDKTMIKADRDDVLVGTVGCLGRAKTKLGTVFAIQSSVGRVYLMTMDGLLLGGVFRDYRLGEPLPSDLQRGMALGGTTMGGDWAGGHFFKSEKSNEFYLIAAGSQMAYHVIKLNGLESMAAIPGGEVTVTEKDLHPNAPAIAEKAVAPTVDGRLEKRVLALDLDKATVKSATVTPVKDGGGTLLKIAIKGNQQGWAGVEIPAQGGKWDLSKYRFVVAQVRNLGSDPVKVNLRLDNSSAADGKGGLANAVADGRSVDPRAGWTWTKVGIRRPADAVKVKLFGMAEYPWGRPYEKAKTGADAEMNDSWWFHAFPWGRPVDTANGSGIDPAKVVKLVISVPDPKEDCTLEIRNICAAGAAPSAELLADPAKFLPCIDEFGQYVHADWPGKTYEPVDLKKRRLDEARDLDANPGPPEWDQYGGWKNGPALEATGYFRVEKYEGKWWLVDPEGKLFFSSGISCVNAGVFEDLFDGGETDETPIQDREPWFRGLAGLQAEFAEHAFKDYRSTKRTGHYGYGPVKTSFDFARANNHRKYGNTWDGDFARVSHRRMKSWGLNTLGIYSSPAICFQRKTPYVMCGRLKPDLVNPRLDHGVFWDVFRVKDARFGPVFSGDFASLCRQFVTRYDDWCIGHIVDDEGRGDPALDTGDSDVAYALGTLRQPYDAADPGPTAKTVFVADMKAKYAQIEKLNDAWGTKHASWEALLSNHETPDVTKAHEDLAAFHAKAFDTYFSVVRTARYFATGLYMGMVFEGASPATIKAAAKHCDVLCFRLNRTSPADFKLPDGIDKPVLIGEFGFSALDRGMLAGDLPDQAARAAAYKEYMLGALRNPQIVGCHWAQFRDYPASGRTRDEANYNAGFVDIADTPYAEMVQAAREVGKTMYKTRLDAK